MEDLVIVAKSNNQNFTCCKPSDVEKEIECAKKFYEEELALVTSHRDNYPNNKDYWQKRIDETTFTLSQGFEAVTFEEFHKREKMKWCTGKIHEISREEYNEALNCLPPVGWVHGDDCEWFFISEMLTFSFTNQYYHDKTNGKYYTAVADLHDRKTWIHNLLEAA